MERDGGHLLLPHPPGEHGTEVGGGGGQHQLVGLQAFRAHHQGDIAQLAGSPQCLHHLQGLLGVLHDGELHAAVRRLLGHHWLGPVAGRRGGLRHGDRWGSEGRTGAAQEKREDGGSLGLATLVRHHCTPHLALAGTAGKLGGLPLATVSHKLHCQ